MFKKTRQYSPARLYMTLANNVAKYRPARKAAPGKSEYTVLGLQFPVKVINRKKNGKQLHVSQFIHGLMNNVKEEFSLNSMGEAIWLCFSSLERIKELEKELAEAKKEKELSLMTLGSYRSTPPRVDLLFTKGEMYQALNKVIHPSILQKISDNQDWDYNSRYSHIIVELTVKQTLREASKHLEDLFHNGTG